ncbi:MAG: HAD hydrolase-like protein [Methylococcales bacterium]|nr:HAD hydrolase-like protein [Methylococcales bacterium]
MVIPFRKSSIEGPFLTFPAKKQDVFYPGLFNDLLGNSMVSICIIFDLDGTLIDSESLCNQAFLDLLPQLNDTLESLIQRYRGKKLASILADIESRLCQSLPDTFEQHYRQRVTELFSRELKPMPGVIEMLKATNFPKCVASSGPSLKIRQALQVSGLAPYLETISSAPMMLVPGSQSQACSNTQHMQWALCPANAWL